jgi:TRAP-type C4-dicarboxylate transport system permease small subunit
MIMLGAMLGVRDGAHFTVDVWPRLAPRAAAALDLAAGLAVLVLACVFLWWGWEFTRFAFRRISELAELPLWWIHVAWPLTGLTWLVFAGERMAQDVRVLRRGAGA